MIDKSKRVFSFVCCFLLLHAIFAQSINLDGLIPKVKVTNSNNPSKGFVYLSVPFTISTGENPYLAVIDNYGTTVFYRKTEPTALTFYRAQPNIMTYFSGYPLQLHFLNNNLKLVDSLGISGEGNFIDYRDYFLTDSGHVLLLGYRQRLVDMSKLVPGGREIATVKDLIIQEFDQDRNLVFVWNSADHFQITDANESSIYIDFTSSVIDYVHVNSIFADSDTSLLISSRYMEEITRIDRRSGDIIWRLGGKNNQFTFVNDPIGFSHQHSIRKLENGNILLFDNGNLHENQISSIVEYKINEQEKTATLVKRIYHEPNVYVNFLGYTQQLINGNYVVGWGHEQPSFSEYNSDGLLVLELDFSAHSYGNSTFKGEWSQSIFNFDVDSIIINASEGENAVNQTVSVSNRTDEPVILSSFSSHTDVFALNSIFPIVINPNSSIPINVIYYPNKASSGYQDDIITLNADNENERIATQIFVEGYKPDSEAPQVIITPRGNMIETDTKIVINFSEAVRLQDDKMLSNENIANVLDVKKDNSNGENVQFNALINTSKTKIELFPIESLEDNQTYLISLAPVLEDFSNNQVLSTQSSFSTGLISGNFEPEQSEIKLYPNPSNGRIFLTFQTKGTYDLLIFDTYGKLVFQVENIRSVNYTIQRGTLIKGVYFLKTINKDNKKEFHQKLIII